MKDNSSPSVARGKVFAVAPMMDWTDRHCRFFHRLLAPHALLYTEMLTAQAVHHGDRQRLLAFRPEEQPVALQLGGSEARLLAEAARIGEDFGYREINLNVGCPSDRVQEGRFGACLMAEPHLVRDLVGAMAGAVTIPVTVKCRIGIDDQDEDGDFETFISTVAEAPCRTFIVHARKAWLKGLSPKENREIPPLNHERVHRLKRQHPGLTVIINGGIASLAAARDHLARVDGIMLGRAAYHMPWLLAEIDREFFGGEGVPGDPAQVVARMEAYAAEEVARGVPLHQITRHVMGLFHGRPGGRRWRRILTEGVARDGRNGAILARALAEVSRFQRLPEAAE